MTAVIGLNASTHCHFSGIDCDRVHDAREQRQHLQEDRDHVADVAVADVDRREEEAEPERRDDREPDEQRREQHLEPAGPRVVVPHERDEHGEPDDEVDERHEDGREREQRPREVDLRDERAGSRRGSCSSPVSADAKYCIGRTPAMTRLGYGTSPDGKFANFPKTTM